MGPIEYPTVTLDGTPYFFKVSLLSSIRLRQFGIDASNPPKYKLLPDGSKDVADPLASLQYVAGQAAACACVMVNGKLKHAGLSPDEVADLIPIDQISKVSAAISEAVEKAAAAVQLSPASAPPIQ